MADEEHGEKRPVERLVMFFTPSKFMFLTHTPGDWCKPGTVHEKDGNYWVVTKWKQERPTALYDGRSATCFEIRGKKL